ncbi:hypothetical protein SAMN06265795_10296 [Noviherbaspirillum humi]|uniref:Regulatory protein, RpfE type n=1 Tax=Noviherbaspirillum humi TaxID=1688639 RepID=A0A239DBD9_9BURK|nr:hypothetical protein [Noviherbaspirillum humi]SNS29639.1 hypothetical protein SAMN06265795_10296 [Noviherbaspirillum humi]
MTHLDILVPFGLPPPEFANDLLRQLNLPALAALLAKSAPTLSTGNMNGEQFARALPHEAWVAERFGLSGRGSPAVASPVMHAAGQPPEAGYWFMLNPVHFHIAQDHIVLTDSRRLGLGEEESRQLFAMAAELFEEAGKPLRYGDAGTWFARADDWRGLQTATPDAASGRNIDIWMPSGDSARAWRKLQNEVQMHWFTHPLNARREAAGAKPVNSLWLWGGSEAQAGIAAGYTHGYGAATPWLRSLLTRLPQHAPAGTGSDLLANPPANGLLVLDELIEPALANDWGDWAARMESFERDWFAPLLEGLRSAKLDQLSLTLTNDGKSATFAATRHSLRKFWVKPSLARLAP